MPEKEELKALIERAKKLLIEMEEFLKDKDVVTTPNKKKDTFHT